MGKVFLDKLFDKILNKASNDILCIYTDYQSDYTEAYTCIIGVPVSSVEEIPNGLMGREFAADKFDQFIAKGEMPQAVVAKWQEIWKKDAELNRKYSYDFEVYGENAQNGENAEVSIYIAMK